MKVLCIDDEPLILSSMVRVLRGHEVTVFLSPQRALDHLLGADRPGYDVILCDMIMAGMSGVDVYVTLHAERPELIPKVVFCSGVSLMPGVDAFLDSVPNRRLDKPYDAEALREVVRSVGSGRG